MQKPIPSTPAGLFPWLREVRDAKGLPIGTRGILLIMAGYATTETGADIRPSISRLADDTGLDRSGLGRNLSAAVEAGWLYVITDNRTAGTPSVYGLSIPTVRGADVDPHPSTEGGADERPHPHPENMGGADVAPQGVRTTVRRGCGPASSQPSQLSTQIPTHVSPPAEPAPPERVFDPVVHTFDHDGPGYIRRPARESAGEKREKYVSKYFGK